MNWLWWIFVFFMVGGFSWVADTGRSALRTRHERRVERLKLVEGGRLALEESHKPPEPVCGCTHHLAKHDRQGKCHERVEVATAWDENRKPKRYEPAQCNCQQYIGPQPLSRIYADDITDLDTAILDAQLKATEPKKPAESEKTEPSKSPEPSKPPELKKPSTGPTESTEPKSGGPRMEKDGD